MKLADYTILERHNYQREAVQYLATLREGDALAHQLERTAERLEAFELDGDLEAYACRVRLYRAVELWETWRDESLERKEHQRNWGYLAIVLDVERRLYLHQESLMLKPLQQAGRLLKRLERNQHR